MQFAYEDGKGGSRPVSSEYRDEGTYDHNGAAGDTVTTTQEPAFMDLAQEHIYCIYNTLINASGRLADAGFFTNGSDRPTTQASVPDNKRGLILVGLAECEKLAAELTQQVNKIA